MSEIIIELVKAAIAEKIAPAIDARAPYAKVMIDAAARAAIEAMREPTSDMINAGADTFTFDQGKPNISGQPTKAWQAMIDVLIAR